MLDLPINAEAGGYRGLSLEELPKWLGLTS